MNVFSSSWARTSALFKPALIALSSWQCTMGARGSFGARSGGRQRVEAVPAAAHGGEQRAVSREVQFLPEVPHVRVDDVGLAFELVLPDGGEDLLAGEELARMPGEVFEE